MFRIGVVGGTGYTGAELIRLVLAHPQMELAVVSSRSESGQPLAALFPNLRGRSELVFSDPDPELLSRCDGVFYATPNGVAMTQVPQLLDAGVKVVDLAADFRLADCADWEHWYRQPHACPERLAEAVYGLTEHHRAEVAGSRLVANPGCYPTAVQLALKPLLAAGAVLPAPIMVDAKSGVSGAGRGASVANLHAEVSENFRAYAASGHRHLPEIRQGLEQAAGKKVELVFVPHLVPMIRGIETTCYLQLCPGQKPQEILEAAYADEPCVDVMPWGSHPETRSVRGTNLCRMALHQAPGTDTLVVTSVIDNLCKGAGGQALQNMNLMLGLDELVGVPLMPLLP